MKFIAAFVAGIALTIATQVLAQMEGQTIPTVTIRDAITQKDLLVCKWVTLLAGGHFIMCAR